MQESKHVTQILVLLHFYGGTLSAVDFVFYLLWSNFFFFIIIISLLAEIYRFVRRLIHY